MLCIDVVGTEMALGKSTRALDQRRASRLEWRPSCKGGLNFEQSLRDFEMSVPVFIEEDLSVPRGFKWKSSRLEDMRKSTSGP